MAAAEDMERIRYGYAAFNSGDLEAFVEYLSEDVELHPVLGELAGGGDVFRGREGAVRWREVITSTLDGFQVTVEDVMPAGDGVYVAFVRFRGTGVASGVQVTLDAANVFTMRDGIVLRMESYQDRDEALRAVGIER